MNIEPYGLRFRRLGENLVTVHFRDGGTLPLEYFVEHFVWGKHQRTDEETPYPYGIDGSESTYAAADYAVRRGLEPDRNLWFDRNLARWFSHPEIDPACHADFMRRQHAANLACRGVLEANYWSLGSDFRGCGSG